MKDFRAYSSDATSSAEASVMGGNAFFLPDIIPISGIITTIVSGLGLSSLALFLRPWRILNSLPFRRAGGISGIFSWGRLISLLMAAGLLLAPQVIYKSVPEWRTVALMCVFFSCVSVMAAIYRCAGSALKCGFWVILTLFLGERAFSGPGPQTRGIGFSIPSVSLPEFSPFYTDESSEVSSEWEDMLTGEPVREAQIVQARFRPRIQRGIPRIQPAAYAKPAEPSAGIVDSLTSSLTKGLVGEVGSALSQSGAALGIPMSQGGRDWQDGSALPESAYFGNAGSGAINLGSLTATSATGSGGGLDQIIGAVSSFLKR
jgi:hypothetical protein